MKEDLLLMIPGPTIVHPRITRAMTTPIVPHRGKEFADMFVRQTARLQSVFKTKNDIFILCGSGTAAMEAGLCNAVAAGEKVLCLTNGKFSERFSEIASAFGYNLITLNFEWGTAVSPEKVQEALAADPDIKAVTMVYNETSTGVKNPVKEIGEIVKNTNAILIVDTISALAGDEFRTDEWNVDICATGSQKCFALPPGLAFISVSKKAWAMFESTDTPTYYLDLLRYRKDKAKAPYTPPVSLVYALEASLDIIDEEGIEARVARHRRMADKVRSEIASMGLELFPASEHICSNTVTAIKVPDDIDEPTLRSRLRNEYKIEIAGGQAQLKGKIIRIGHMGIVGDKEVAATITCLKEVIASMRA